MLYRLGERVPELRGEYHFIAGNATVIGSVQTATSRMAQCCTPTPARYVEQMTRYRTGLGRSPRSMNPGWPSISDEGSNQK